MNVKKKNALFGRYPSCDMLNNALRFLRKGKTDVAIEEIIFAIEKAGGYFHEDNVQMVTDAKKRWEETHQGRTEMESPRIQSARPGVFFHGEEWYTCPRCGYGIEAQECIYERSGIKKVEGMTDVYICPQCHNMFRLPGQE